MTLHTWICREFFFCLHDSVLTLCVDWNDDRLLARAPFVFYRGGLEKRIFCLGGHAPSSTIWAPWPFWLKTCPILWPFLASGPELDRSWAKMATGPKREAKRPKRQHKQTGLIIWKKAKMWKSCQKAKNKSGKGALEPKWLLDFAKKAKPWTLPKKKRQNAKIGFFRFSLL